MHSLTLALEICPDNERRGNRFSSSLAENLHLLPTVERDRASPAELQTVLFPDHLSKDNPKAWEGTG